MWFARNGILIMKTEIKYLPYKGKGNHTVNELEKIIEQREEELHLIKSGDVVKNNLLLPNRISNEGIQLLVNLSNLHTTISES